MRMTRFCRSRQPGTDSKDAQNITMLFFSGARQIYGGLVEFARATFHLVFMFPRDRWFA